MSLERTPVRTTMGPLESPRTVEAAGGMDDTCLGGIAVSDSNPLVPRDKTREAHATFDKTRCAAWLAATGNRPRSKVGLVAQEETAILKSPQPVEKVAKPNPGVSCDVHPVEDV